MRYAELDVTTNFSFLRGASSPVEMVLRASELGMHAIAITDHNSLAGVVRAHEEAKEAKMKLLIGARLTLVDSPDVLIWAPDRQSYASLCRLLTLGKRRAAKGECQLSLADLIEHISGLHAAIVPPKLRNDAMVQTISQLQHAMPADRLSLVVQNLFDGDDESRLASLDELSRTSNIALVATNAVHYHDPSRRQLQDILTCIRHGCSISEAGYRLFPNGERYLKSPEMMQQMFAKYPAAIERTIHIADQCTFSLDELRYEYPNELVPAGKSTIEHLTQLTWTGAASRYPDGVPESVRDRIEHELKLIDQLQYGAYFLTVHDLVLFARSRHILCQGRGSAANSAVCYCLGVTSVDPARADLLFERFVSAARNEPPDIDVDFEHERREEVIQYVYEKYGRDRAGMTGVVTTYRGRSAVRDIGKALGLGLDLVDQMARKLDGWNRGTVSRDQMLELGLNPDDQSVQNVIGLTQQLLGFPRHLSQHVGGLVMTRGLLCELVPIENATMEGRTVIEWDKNDIDALGILKVDVLALGMLTCISKCIAMLNDRSMQLAASNPRISGGVLSSPPDANQTVADACGSLLQMHTIPAEDSDVYDMICRADTVGVFQIESRAQMSMLPRLKPRCFYDLVIEVAIVRPGPIQGNMVHPYLRRRNGLEPVVFPSDALRKVLEKTLGVPLFQEQAMRIAMVGAGFTGEEADKLRRAMAAWRRTGAIDAFHQKMVTGMLANGYTLDFAEHCFTQIKGFGEYGFPESHAASFALLVYVSCWLKHHHPAAFCAAILNSQPMGFYAPAQLVRDAKVHGVEVRPVDINHSFWDCTLEYNPVTNCNQAADPPAVRLGFSQVQGLRAVHIAEIIEARKKPGQFKCLSEVYQKTKIPAKVIHRLAKADAFSSVGLSRRQALWQALALKDMDAPLFDHISPESIEPTVDLPIMPLGQEVMTDYSAIGLSLKKHPVELIRAELETKQITCSSDLRQIKHGRWVKVCGLVLVRQRPGTASGIVFVTLEDETGVANLIITSNIYDQFRNITRHSMLLQAEGYLEKQGEVIHILAKKLADWTDLLDGYRLRSRDFH